MFGLLENSTSVSPMPFVEDSSTLLEDGLDDMEFAKYQEHKGHSKRPRAGSNSLASGRISSIFSMCQSVLSPCAVDYIETAYSLLHKVETDYDEIRKIVTGGEADGWYLASWPASCRITASYFVPMLPQGLSEEPCGNAVHQIKPGCVAQSQDTDAVQAAKLPVAGACTSSVARAKATSQTTATAAMEILATKPPVKEQHGNTSGEGTAPRTTVMLRNIPTSCSRTNVLDLLRSNGLAHHVDFIYVPMNMKSPGNFGYAFVCFDSPTAAEQCKEQIEGYTAWCGPSGVALQVEWSESQGLENLVERYRNSPIMHKSVEDGLKPAVFKNGSRVAFPPPTKPVRAPRMRRA